MRIPYVDVYRNIHRERQRERERERESEQERDRASKRERASASLRERWPAAGRLSVYIPGAGKRLMRFPGHNSKREGADTSNRQTDIQEGPKDHTDSETRILHSGSKAQNKTSRILVFMWSFVPVPTCIHTPPPTHTHTHQGTKTKQTKQAKQTSKTNNPAHIQLKALDRHASFGVPRF